MSVIRAYHAGDAQNVHALIKGEGIPESQSRHNWMGAGIYFWDSDPLRAERWLARQGRELILECELETGNLFDLLNQSQGQEFFSLAEKHLPRIGNNNTRENRYFGGDGEIIERVRPKLLELGFCGIRMAFCLDGPLIPDGNIYRDQHIQICVWDASIIRNPRKYVPGLET